MIRRKLLISIATVASVGITACSDMTTPRKLVPGGSPAAATLAPPLVAAADREGNREHVRVVATIKARGTSLMTAPGLGRGKTVIFSGPGGIKLLSDHSATGHVTCIDVFGKSNGAGNIQGDVTSWSTGPDGSMVLTMTNVTFFEYLPPDGHPGPVMPGTPVTMKIQKFGGARVGHWTMEEDGLLYCYETMTSGQIVIVYGKDEDRDHGGGDDSGR